MNDLEKDPVLARTARLGREHMNTVDAVLGSTPLVSTYSLREAFQAKAWHGMACLETLRILDNLTTYMSSPNAGPTILVLFLHHSLYAEMAFWSSGPKNTRWHFLHDSLKEAAQVIFPS